MKKNLWLICLMVFVFMFSLTVAWAQEKKPDVKKEEAVKIDAKEMVDYSKQVELFTQVVTYGETKKDALILLTAVRMLDEFPFDGIVKPGEKEKGGARYDREALLKQAKEYASGDKELLAMIEKFKDVPEQTLVRGHHHGGHHGGHHHGGHHGMRCFWIRVCGPWGCEWVCR